MKKKLLSILMLVILTSSMVIGCTNKESDTITNKPKDAVEKTERITETETETDTETIIDTETDTETNEVDTDVLEHNFEYSNELLSGTFKTFKMTKEVAEDLSYNTLYDLKDIDNYDVNLTIQEINEDGYENISADPDYIYYTITNNNGTPQHVKAICVFYDSKGYVIDVDYNTNDAIVNGKSTICDSIFITSDYKDYIDHYEIYVLNTYDEDEINEYNSSLVGIDVDFTFNPNAGDNDMNAEWTFTNNSENDIKVEDIDCNVYALIKYTKNLDNKQYMNIKKFRNLNEEDFDSILKAGESLTIPDDIGRNASEVTNVEIVPYSIIGNPYY